MQLCKCFLWLVALFLNITSSIAMPRSDAPLSNINQESKHPSFATNEAKIKNRDQFYEENIRLQDKNDVLTAQNTELTHLNLVCSNECKQTDKRPTTTTKIFDNVNSPSAAPRTVQLDTDGLISSSNETPQNQNSKLHEETVQSRPMSEEMLKDQIETRMRKLFTN